MSRIEKIIFAPKLRRGNKIQVISPSSSLAVVPKRIRIKALSQLGSLGLKVSFSKHSEEMEHLYTSSIESRIEDLKESIKNPGVKAIIAAEGGFCCNQMLNQMDWRLIKRNPKIYCGYSDFTVLANAIYSKTKLVTYLGPDFTTFGIKKHSGYTNSHFKKCLFSKKPYNITQNTKWSDVWSTNGYPNSKSKFFTGKKKWTIINEGEGKGVIVGGNLSSLNLLFGTKYFYINQPFILFLEDDQETKPATFDRIFQSFIHQPFFKHIRGIIVGRFQKKSGMSARLLKKIFLNKPEVRDIPIVSDINFGHILPIITIPIGGMAKLKAKNDSIKIKILKH